MYINGEKIQSLYIYIYEKYKVRSIIFEANWKMDRFEFLKDIGSGNFGVAKLVRDKWSGELYAVKYIQRGQKVLYVPSFLRILIWVGGFCFYEF